MAAAAARARDGPPAPEELLLIVLRYKRRPTRGGSTRASWRCSSPTARPRPGPVYAVRSEHVEDYLALLAARGLAEASRALALAAISAYYRRAVHERRVRRTRARSCAPDARRGEAEPGEGDLARAGRDAARRRP